MDRQRFPTELEDVSQVLIPDQRDCPNSYRLMNSPITRSCIRSVLEKQIVRRTNRLMRVRRLMCLLSIFWVFSLHLLYAPLTIPLVYCYINSFQRASRVGRP